MPAIDSPATQRRRKSPLRGSRARCTRAQARRSTTCTARPSGKACWVKRVRSNSWRSRYWASGDCESSQAELIRRRAACSARRRDCRDRRPRRIPCARLLSGRRPARRGAESPPSVERAWLIVGPSSAPNGRAPTQVSANSGVILWLGIAVSPTTALRVGQRIRSSRSVDCVDARHAPRDSSPAGASILTQSEDWVQRAANAVQSLPERSRSFPGSEDRFRRSDKVRYYWPSGIVGRDQPRGTLGRLLRLWQAGAFELVLSHILAELEATLRDPYFQAHLSPDSVTATRHIEGAATHPEDEVILATAASGGADYLIAGDRQL